jgi:hypothetical protein
MLDLLFLSAADIVLLTANANVGEWCLCRCQWGSANANGATVESTVEDGSEQCRSIGGDNLVRNERV